MKKILLSLIFSCLLVPVAFAQFNFGAKIGTGLSRLKNSEKVLLSEPTNYAYDVTPNGNVFDYNTFVNYRIKKTAIRVNLSYMRNDFKMFYSRLPYFLDDGGFLSYPDEIFPVYIQAEYKFRFIYTGIEINQYLGKKWSIGAGLNYGIKHFNYTYGLFDLSEKQKKYMITRMRSYIAVPEQLDGSIGKNGFIVWGGYRSHNLHPIFYKFNMRYNMGELWTLIGEYQHNFASMSMLNDYRFHLLTIGLEFNFFKQK